MSIVVSRLTEALNTLINTKLLRNAKPIELTETKCTVGSFTVVDPTTKLSDLGEYKTRFFSKPTTDNFHMALEIETNSTEKILCLDKSLLTKIYKSGDKIISKGKYESDINKATELHKLIDTLSFSKPEFTFHYSDKHKNMFIIYQAEPPAPKFNIIKFDFDPIKLSCSGILKYGETKAGKASTITRGESNQLYVKLFKTDNEQCFKVGGGGGANPKAKVMHRIRLTSPTPPEVFIIGRYAHPRAPYIVLPAMRSWITKTQITFPTTAPTQSKLVVYRKGNQLIAPTPGNKYDVFNVSHIVSVIKRPIRGGGLTLVVDDKDNNTKCVAKKHKLTKNITNSRYSGLKDTNDQDVIVTVEKGLLTIYQQINGENQIVPIYPFNTTDNSPAVIILHENPERPVEYIMAEASV